MDFQLGAVVGRRLRIGKIGLFLPLFSKILRCSYPRVIPRIHPSQIAVGSCVVDRAVSV